MWININYNEFTVSEWVVIMGIREETKQHTRENIIEVTTNLLLIYGYFKLSSKVISEECNVSQGTIFLHFGTKNNLLNEILFSNVDKLEDALNERCIPTETQDNFIKNFLNTLSDYEDILSRTYKDFFYLSDSLQKQIIDLETLIKSKFFDNLKHNRSNNINIIDSFILIDSFISQIKSYLLEKNVYSISNSVLKQKRGRIMKLYRMLFQ